MRKLNQVTKAKPDEEKNKFKSVPFEVVEVWFNDSTTPYSAQPLYKDSVKIYAIKINDDVFMLGRESLGLHICEIDGGCF